MLAIHVAVNAREKGCYFVLTLWRNVVCTTEIPVLFVGIHSHHNDNIIITSTKSNHESTNKVKSSIEYATNHDDIDDVMEII